MTAYVRYIRMQLCTVCTYVHVYWMYAYVCMYVCKVGVMNLDLNSNSARVYSHAWCA